MASMQDMQAEERMPTLRRFIRQTAPPDDARLPRFQAVDHVLDTPGLSDAGRVAIPGGNAAALFDIPV